jgi:4-hydroxybenzoyl-CoA thioesterase
MRRWEEDIDSKIMLTSRRKILIEWGDCDPAGIVYFPRYFEMFDACTAGLFAAAGLACEKITTGEMIVLPMVDIHSKFMIPSKYGDEVMVETTITEFCRSSFVVRHRMYKGDELAVECEETRVWAGKHPDDPSRLKGKPIPLEVIARFKEE